MIADHRPLPDGSVEGVALLAHLFPAKLMVPPGWYALPKVMAELENAKHVRVKYVRRMSLVWDIVPGNAQSEFVSMRPLILTLKV